MVLKRQLYDNKCNRWDDAYKKKKSERKEVRKEGKEKQKKIEDNIL